ncbi:MULTISPECIES: FecR domain-containing protein [unclassified Sphingomonas]|uniref:FecR family protein n=1 Tax=unclassified Sphingomonas TaxID=196159 RepID=UPI001F58271D|nr:MULTISPECIES: FecR domain-containing protein [unclassified Sphingomonas]
MTGPFETIEDEAASWVARMDSGRWDATDEAALAAWLALDATRAGLLLRTQAAWAAADLALIPAGSAATCDDLPAVVRPFWRRRNVLAGLAATIVAGVIGTTRIFAPETRYVTNLGEIRRVPLADGSTMTINSASALTVRIDAHTRQIALVQGEAWFEVAHDPARPFVVTAAGVTAQALGTAFSVRVRTTGVEILVTDGTVETRHADTAKVIPATRLIAGQRAFVDAQAAVRLEADRASAVDRALAWRGGMIDLEGDTLATAAEEFNRYNARKIVVSDPQLAGEKLDGVFRINDPEGFALAVKVSLNATVVDAAPDTIRITR